MADIKVIRSLTSDGLVSVRYVCDEISCMHVELTSASAISAAKHQLVYKELEFCEALLLMYLDKYTIPDDGIKTHDLKSNEDLTLRAAYVAAVVTYGKVFTKTGKGRMRLDHDRLFKDDGSGFKEFHTWIMEVHRHRYVAHAVGDEMENARTVLIFHPPFMGSECRMALPHASFSPSLHPDDVAKFLTVVRYVKSWVYARIDDLVRHILNETLQYPLSSYHQNASYATVCPLPQAAPPINPELATPVK